MRTEAEVKARLAELETQLAKTEEAKKALRMRRASDSEIFLRGIINELKWVLGER